MISTTAEYEPSIRASIASHGSDKFFGCDRPSVLGLELTSEPVYKGPFADCKRTEPTIPQSESTGSFGASLDSSSRIPDTLETPTACYFAHRPDSGLPASSLPPPLRTQPKSVVAKAETPLVAPRPTAASVPSSASSHSSAAHSRSPSVVISRPNSACRQSRPPSRARSLAEEIADVGEEVPKADLDDDDDNVSWAAVLGGPADFVSRVNDQSFERQRAAFPPPRSRTSSLSSYNVNSRTSSRTLSFSGKSIFSSKSLVSTPPRTPDSGGRPKGYRARHSFQVEQLSRPSPTSSLAPTSPNEDPISPKRANSISGLPSLHSLRSFRSNRRSSGKVEPNGVEINIPAVLSPGDLPSPVPELPNEQNDGGSAPSSTHSRESLFYPRFGMQSTTPTPETRKPRLSFSKVPVPKMFKKNASNSHQQLSTTLTTIETTEELAPNGDIIERTYTTTRRPSASSRFSFHSHRSGASHPSPSGSAPATPGTPDHYVENSPLQYVVNTTSRAPSVPPTPPPAPVFVKERKEIKPIMIVDYVNYPGATTYRPSSPQKAPTPGSTPSRPTVPRPPVRSQPSTPNTVPKAERSVSSTPSVAATIADGPVPPLPEPMVPPPKAVVSVAPSLVANVAPTPPIPPTTAAAPVSPAFSSRAASPTPAPKASKTQISVGSKATIEITTALEDGPKEDAPAAADHIAAATPGTIEAEIASPAAIVEVKTSNADITVNTTAPAASTEDNSTKAPSVKAASPGPSKPASVKAESPMPAPSNLPSPKARSAPKLPSESKDSESAKPATQINIDPKSRSVEVITGASPTAAASSSASVTSAAPTPAHVATNPVPASKIPTLASPKKLVAKDKSPKTSPKLESQAQLTPTPVERSRSPSLRSIDARVRRSPESDEVIVTFTSRRGSIEEASKLGAAPKERMKHPKEHHEKEVQQEVERRVEAEKMKEKAREAQFIPFIKAASVPVTPEKQRVRPEHVKHLSVDSFLTRSPHSNHAHSKHHSVDTPRYPRSVSYDHAHTPSHLNVSHSRLSSRRNSLESNASFATIDSRGVLRKRRVLNPMTVGSGSGSDGGDADNSDTGSETDGETRNDGVEIDYHETESGVSVKITARVTPKTPNHGKGEDEIASGDERDNESAAAHQELREEIARTELHKRIQAAQRLMKQNPRLPSEIDDVPASLPAGAMHGVPPPQHWPRPAPHPALRPLYLGGRAFGAPVSTGMMPGLGYAAGQLGGSSYLGMGLGPVPMMLSRPPASQPGWYPARPRP